MRHDQRLSETEIDKCTRMGVTTKCEMFLLTVFCKLSETQDVNQHFLLYDQLHTILV